MDVELVGLEDMFYYEDQGPSMYLSSPRGWKALICSGCCIQSTIPLHWPDPGTRSQEILQGTVWDGPCSYELLTLVQATVNSNLRCRGARASFTTLRRCRVYLGDMTRNRKKVPSIASSRPGLDLIGTEPGPARDLPWHGIKTRQHLSNKFL